MFRCGSIAIRTLVGLAILALSSSGSVVHAQSTVNFVLESWRVEDTSIWEDTILPAYQATHPGVNIAYRPTASTYYQAALDTVHLGAFFQPWLGQEGSALIALSFISAWQFVGMPMMLYLTSLITIPGELIEAARVDGASAWTTFWRIQLP